MLQWQLTESTIKLNSGFNDVKLLSWLNDEVV